MPAAKTERHASRVVPKWAAGLMSHLAQRVPAVVSEATMARYLEETKTAVEPEVAMMRLVRLGWLRKTHFNGAYAFMPPGVDAIADPYIDLRGWRLIRPDARFFLAGASAA